MAITSLSPITSLALPLPGHCLFSGVSQSWRGRGEREREREREREGERERERKREREKEGKREERGREGKAVKPVAYFTYVYMYSQSNYHNMHINQLFDSLSFLKDG